MRGNDQPASSDNRILDLLKQYFRMCPGLCSVACLVHVDLWIFEICKSERISRFGFDFSDYGLADFQYRRDLCDVAAFFQQRGKRCDDRGDGRFLSDMAFGVERRLETKGMFLLPQLQTMERRDLLL